MATDKRQYTLRLQEETFEKLRYLAFLERRSIAMEVEHAVITYIEQYEKDHGAVQVPQAE